MFSAANTVINPQNASPLASLAAEIRILIYLIVFKVFNVNSGYSSTKITKRPTISENRDKSTPSSVLALLATCRFFYNEAELYFYQLNQLEIVEIAPTWRQAYDLDHAHNHWQWWNTLTSTRWTAIQAMTVRIESADQGLTMFRFLRTMPNLRKITLWVTHTTARQMLSDDMIYRVMRTSGIQNENAATDDFFVEVAMFKLAMGIKVSTAGYAFNEYDQDVLKFRRRILAA